MNYFLVQLSIADLLTTGLTLFPEIGEKQSKSYSKKIIVLKTIKKQLKQMMVIIEQGNTHNIAKHHRTQELNAFAKVNAFTTQPAMNKITPSCDLTNLISPWSPKYEQCLCQALVKL